MSRSRSFGGGRIQELLGVMLARMQPLEIGDSVVAADHRLAVDEGRGPVHGPGDAAQGGGIAGSEGTVRFSREKDDAGEIVDLPNPLQPRRLDS